jgi:hypothetical protein
VLLRTSDVDALLAEITRPAAEIKSKRARAEFLRVVLKSGQLSHLEGRDGKTVHAAAVQALKDLGPPYSLRIPTEQPPRIPIFGIVLAVIAVAGPAIIGTPEAFQLLERGNPVGLLLMALVFGAPGSAIFGGWSGQRWLQLLGVWVMGLASLGCALVGFWLFSAFGDEGRTLGVMFGLMALGLSFVTGLSAALLAPSWFPEDEEPDES